MILNELTPGELIAHAESKGFDFKLTNDVISYGGPLLGYDRELTRAVGAISREIRRRGKGFLGFLELKLLVLNTYEPKRA